MERLHPIRSLSDQSRANVLYRQQQARQRDGWKFEEMSRQDCDLMRETYGDDIDIVYDHEQGGAWWRNNRQIAKPARRTSLTAKSNRYDRPVTRFGDLMSGLSRIAKGLQEIDHATDGDLGDSLMDLLR